MVDSCQSVLFLLSDLRVDGEGAKARSIALSLPSDRFRLAVAVLRQCDLAELSALSQAGIAVRSAPVRHVMDLGEGSLEALRLLDERGAVRPRLRLAPWCQPGIDGDGLRELIELQGTSGRLWTVAGVKLFMDGTIDNGTAWLHRPDCYGESTKPFWLPPQDYADAVAALADVGVATATHAIGDAAVAFALDCLRGREFPRIGGGGGLRRFRTAGQGRHHRGGQHATQQGHHGLLAWGRAHRTPAIRVPCRRAAPGRG